MCEDILRSFTELMVAGLVPIYLVVVLLHINHAYLVINGLEFEIIKFHFYFTFPYQNRGKFEIVFLLLVLCEFLELY